MEFRWTERNVEHVGEHGIEPAEAEILIRSARTSQWEYRGDRKWLVRGRGLGGRFLQVIFVISEDGAIIVIHARPMSDAEKRRYRRRGK
jgi:uncharacterized DUF497 family protein